MPRKIDIIMMMLLTVMIFQVVNLIVVEFNNEPDPDSDDGDEAGNKVEPDVFDRDTCLNESSF